MEGQSEDCLDERLPLGQWKGGAAVAWWEEAHIPPEWVGQSGRRYHPDSVDEGWTGRGFHLGTNKEVFDAEVFAVLRALKTLNERNESGRGLHSLLRLHGSPGPGDVRPSRPGAGTSEGRTCHGGRAPLERAHGYLKMDKGMEGNEMANFFARAVADSAVTVVHRWPLTWKCLGVHTDY